MHDTASFIQVCTQRLCYQRARLFTSNGCNLTFERQVPCIQERVLTIYLTMSQCVKPKCFKCRSTRSEMWEKVEGKGTCCVACRVKLQVAEEVEKDCKNEDSKKPEVEIEKQVNKGDNGTKTVNASPRTLRKATKGKAKKTVATVPKGKGRRFIFKKRVYKSPAAICTVVNSTSLYFEGQYYQVGDIVSLQDVEGGVYYAQIRGLLQDQYCEKSAVISWLLPTQSSPPPEEGFHPETYVLGPDEEVPRKLDCMMWVCHAPSDYYHARGSPFPICATPTRPELGFVWTNFGKPLIRPVSELEQMSKKGELDQKQE